MRFRKWYATLDETDRKGAAAWGIFVGLAVAGTLWSSVGWIVGVIIGGAWLVFFLALVICTWIGTTLEAGRVVDRWVVEQRKLPRAVPDLGEVTSARSRDTKR